LRVIVATPAREEGGVLRAVLDLAAGLQQRGHDVMVATPRDAEAVQVATAARQLASVDLERSARTAADVWHLHANNSLDPVLLSLLARRRTAAGARVLTEHLPRTFHTDASLPLDPDMVHGRRKPGARHAKTVLKRLEFALCDQVLTPAAASADFLARRYRVPRSAIATIHNGVPVPDRAAPPPEAEVLEVLVVGMLVHRKGQDVLLEAAARAREPWNVTFVGEGGARPALEQAAARIEHRRIRFAGWRADAAAAPLDCHVACVPSRAESFPYVALEAMACARAMVASRIDGLSEVVEDGATGLLVAPEDPAALAAALDALAADRARVRRIGEAAHARVRDRFGIDAMLDATLGLYRRLGRVSDGGRTRRAAAAARSAPSRTR
jgi:glycosyltransferase involved in cell wall biosynthesis